MGNKNVDLEHALAMNNVKAGVALNRFGDHLIVHIEFIFQGRNKWLKMLKLHFGHDVNILDGAYHAVEGAGK